jgi:hypothetical protein
MAAVNRVVIEQVQNPEWIDDRRRQDRNKYKQDHQEPGDKITEGTRSTPPQIDEKAGQSTTNG